jgi:predicted nuclease of restriction endonuclease-like (RecB) superfamily
MLSNLAERLKANGVKGCSFSNLKSFRQFYQAYPEISQTVSGQLRNKLLLEELGQKFRLNWSHYQILMSLPSTEERGFYEIEAATNQWSIRELERQIASALFERLALSRDQDEIKRLASQGQIIEAPRDAIKSPYILEFLELEERPHYSENDLETAIIDKLEHFLLELGKGFLFEARQKRFSFEEQHFRVDLVFYNRLLRCYVLIDLKLGKLTHQDLGQMQMYVNYFDRHVKVDGENPTIGIVLCKRKNDALVELTLPKDANIFASQYQLYLPSKEELQRQLQEAAQEAEFVGLEETQS